MALKYLYRDHFKANVYIIYYLSTWTLRALSCRLHVSFHGLRVRIFAENNKDGNEELTSIVLWVCLFPPLEWFRVFGARAVGFRRFRV